MVLRPLLDERGPARPGAGYRRGQPTAERPLEALFSRGGRCGGKPSENEPTTLIGMAGGQIDIAVQNLLLAHCMQPARFRAGETRHRPGVCCGGTRLNGARSFPSRRVMTTRYDVPKEDAPQWSPLVSERESRCATHTPMRDMRASITSTSTASTSTTGP